MQAKPKLKTVWRIGVGLAAGALVLAACGSTPASKGKSGGNTTATTAPSHITRGGTVYWAQGAQAKPNWIFPFASLSYFSVTNLTQFQELMYRPLYWFGSPTSAAPDVDFALSTANAPVWNSSSSEVTISLKGWKFRSGQVVDAQAVIFWLNMMKVEGAANWAGYAEGPKQFPGNIKSYEAASPTATSLTITLNGTYNQSWYLYNELSQITPMAEAWDVTSLTATPGSGGCGTVLNGKQMTGTETSILKDCAAVWKFDTDNGGTATHAQMSGDIDTYGTNPLWQSGTDGPWILSGFNGSSGEATFTPNTLYNGPQKPYISKFVELPYTTSAAEFNALAAGGSQAPQVGYLPSSNTPQKTSTNPLSPGANASQLTSSYNLVINPTWSINYFPENFDSTKGADGHAGSVFKQLYFRQTLQEMVNQTGIISDYFKGYGVPTYGPVPVYPTNNFAAGAELETGGPYPFSETNAVNNLKKNGWNVVPGGTSTCAKAGTASGDCGAGIPAGTPLTFSEVYVGGDPTLESEVNYEVSEWAKAGIKVTTKQTTFDDVLGIAAACLPKITASCQNWDMANWGGGWLFAPDYLPTGEEIFATGAGSNSGNYNDPKNNSYIIQTNTSTSKSIFTTWENYLADQLPVIWQPDGVGETEIAKDLGGVTPINALANLDPEYWYFTNS
ncbi:MAG: ABC transporter substrate-binding protein [Acidimicrobiales bacterium]